MLSWFKSLSVCSVSYIASAVPAWVLFVQGFCKFLKTNVKQLK